MARYILCTRHNLDMKRKAFSSREVYEYIGGAAIKHMRCDLGNCEITPGQHCFAVMHLPDYREPQSLQQRPERWAREYLTPIEDPGLDRGAGPRSKCCSARMVNGGIQCESCGSDGS